MSKLKLSCQEANHVCDKNQYKEASFWEKVKLNIHLIYCAACRKYSMRNGKLTKVMRSSKLEVLDQTSKEKMHTAFEKELAKHQ
jgi:Zn-finger nucleic acid-binding protein